MEATSLEPVELDRTKAELPSAAQERSCVGEGSEHDVRGIVCSSLRYLWVAPTLTMAGNRAGVSKGTVF